MNLMRGVVGWFGEPQEMCSWKLYGLVNLRRGVVGCFGEPQEGCSWMVW